MLAYLVKVEKNQTQEKSELNNLYYRTSSRRKENMFVDGKFNGFTSMYKATKLKHSVSETK